MNAPAGGAEGVLVSLPEEPDKRGGHQRVFPTACDPDRAAVTPPCPR